MSKSVAKWSSQASNRVFLGKEVKTDLMLSDEEERTPKSFNGSTSITPAFAVNRSSSTEFPN